MFAWIINEHGRRSSNGRTLEAAQPVRGSIRVVPERGKARDAAIWKCRFKSGEALQQAIDIKMDIK